MTAASMLSSVRYRLTFQLKFMLTVEQLSDAFDPFFVVRCIFRLLLLHPPTVL